MSARWRPVVGQVSCPAAVFSSLTCVWVLRVGSLGMASESVDNTMGDLGESICKLCKRNLPAGSPGRLRGKSWTCRHCLSMESMLFRHLGSSDQQGWSTEARADFFRKTASLQTGQFNWETVRTMIIQSQSVQRIKEQQNKVSAKALPLGVWLTKGWTKEHVEQFPAETDPILGQLYAVPVKETTMKEIRRLVEEEIERKEQAAKKMKSSRKRVGEDEQEEEWDVVVPSASNAEGQPRKAAKAAAKASAKEAKTLEKERAQQEKSNGQVSELAARAAGVLSKTLKSLQSCVHQCNRANIEPERLPDLKDAITRCEEWNNKAAHLLGLAAATKGSGAKLPDLPFDSKDLSDLVKAANGELKSVRQALKNHKDDLAKKKETEKQEAEAGQEK